jgi:hypothetical protein
MSFDPSGGTLSGASDVALSNPATGQFLAYSTSVSKWQNNSLSGTAALATSGGLESLSTNFTATGAVTLDLSQANCFRITLTGNVTLTFSGATNNKACSFSLHVKQDGTGSRTLTFPASVQWPGGTAPTASTAAGAYDIWVFETITGGTTWFGAQVGKAYS